MATNRETVLLVDLLTSRGVTEFFKREDSIVLLGV